ncbi:MAG: AI-2E family transporter [Brotaphodocola sp.]
MNSEKYRRYINWGVTGLVVVALLIGLVFVVIKWSWVYSALDKLQGILAPVIYGMVFAYLLTPVYNRANARTIQLLKKHGFGEDGCRKLGSFIGIVASLLVVAVVICGLVWLVIPQLITIITGIVEALPTNIRNLGLWLEQVFADNPEVEAYVTQSYTKLIEYGQNWIKTDVAPNLRKIVTGVSSGLLTVVDEIFNVIIGVIVTVYLLNKKTQFQSQCKMILYSVLPVKMANKVIEECRYVHEVFGGFIIGKLLDSLIIGIMCFVLLNLMNMPYVLLLSVIIGVTNVIPFFGPFIGAVPCAILVLLTDPIKCLYFVIFILILQQFDGNILGPKILGNSTGLDSFWVLFSILLFGGMFGFMGMIIGVPTFAVLYRMVREFVTYMLEKRELSADISNYENLDYIDGEKKTFIKK